MTGREKLAVMTSTEIAKLIVSNCDCCAYSRDATLCAIKPCREGIAVWLESEVPDGDD